VTEDLASLDVGVDGAAVLAAVHEALTRYVVFPCPEAADAAALYAAATHAANDLEFASRLVIKSPVKRCGKSRLLDVLGLSFQAFLIVFWMLAGQLWFWRGRCV
jgi:hypothetical protein